MFCKDKSDRTRLVSPSLVATSGLLGQRQPKT